MLEHITIENKFIWVPIDKRKSRFGGGPMPYRKPENRRPILWLAREKNDVYLVNSSEETLDFVIADGGGFFIDDDDIVTFGGKKYEYKNVKPNNAVKVEEYDDFYDSDFFLQISLRVQSQKLGCINILSPTKKGGIGETVLLWDTGESGKYVLVQECSSEESQHIK